MRDRGFTMVELMVALLILSVAVVAVSQVFLVSLRTASLSYRRTEATGLAVRTIESMNSIPWDELGFSSSQTDYSSTFVDGSTTYNTVQVTQPPQLSPVPAPVTLGGRTYNLHLYIYWVDAIYNGQTKAEANKKSSVFVTWTDPIGAHTVRQDGVVYPGSQGSYKGAQGGGASPTPSPAPGQPNPATLDAAKSVTAPSSTIVLTWTPGASPPNVEHWRVQYSTDNFGVSVNDLSLNQPSGATSFSAAGLASGKTYQFRVGAYPTPNGSPTWSNVATESTAPATSTGACTITSETVTPSPVQSDPNSTQGYLKSDISVTVHSTGTCQSLSVRYTPIASNERRVLLMSDTPGTTWTGTLDGKATNWDKGDHFIAVWDEIATTPFAGPAGLTVT